MKKPDSYPNLNLKEPSIQGHWMKKERHNERGRSTHFRMTYKKGTV